MSGDTLSDLLRAVRLHGAVFYYIEGAPPWVAEAPHAREIIPAIIESFPVRLGSIDIAAYRM